VTFLSIFFSYAPLKMDRFLQNSNKRCESENKEGTSPTSGKSEKKRKNLKYDDSYLDFGFTSTEVDGEEKPKCVLCLKILASECMLPSKLKSHLDITHPSIVSKSRDYFSRKLRELNQQKNSFYKWASIPSNALLASYKVAHRITKCKKPHIIAKKK
jgi:Fe-S cluster assembly ATPase SufC